ncbi:hypothetical protein HNR22_001849 [Micromonospora jinlongensis]|uniref:PH domain-containing protein n=1 Tax=Micromonospora jinlongensis TaxID=1287877 RepID=A0A7Y9WYX8_9ACTN|nr:hypothetical protein [Micromonospora jinlongensis]NYH42122.1 hypothetical protein [Micromonospora jinlongensis]
MGEVHVLGQSRAWPAIAIPSAALVVMIVVGVLFEVVNWTALMFGVASIILAFTRWRNAVFADDLGLLVRDRGGLRRSYAWDEIERMGWVDAGMWGSSLSVYPRGGPYDVPGPNASINVGRIWRPRRRHLADPLPTLLETHGIKTLLDR